MEGYRYHCIQRRPEADVLPEEGLIYYEGFLKAQKYSREIRALTWGYAVYTRRLTVEEMERHGLREGANEKCGKS